MNAEATALKRNCFFHTIQAILENSMTVEPAAEKPIDPLDVACVRQIQAGRTDLIEALVRKHADRLHHIILCLVRSSEAAEDILQDTWVLVMRNLHKFDAERPLAPWLTQIAVNVCRSHWRRERLRSLLKPAKIIEKIKPSESEPASAFDIQREAEARKLADAALESLSPRLREIVVLKFYSGLTYEEIAGALKIPVGTAKSRLSFALMKMREFTLEERK